MLFPPELLAIVDDDEDDLGAGLLFLFWAANAAVAARANAIEPARIIFFILIPPLVVGFG